MSYQVDAHVMLVAVVRELRPQPNLVVNAAVQRADKQELLDKAFQHGTLLALAIAGLAQSVQQSVESTFHRACFLSIIIKVYWLYI